MPAGTVTLPPLTGLYTKGTPLQTVLCTEYIAGNGLIFTVTEKLLPVQKEVDGVTTYVIE